MAHKTIIREPVPDISAERPEAQGASPECRHCYGGGWVLEQVETTFGEYEDVSYICSMCRGTGKAMTKAERKAGRA